MAYDFSEVQELNRKRREAKILENKAELKQMVLAQAPARQLTGNPGWDLLLQAIQGQIERATARLQSINNILIDPEKLDHNEYLLCKVRAANCLGLITALEMVAQFPKEFMTRGAEAVEILKGLGDS